MSLNSSKSIGILNLFNISRSALAVNSELQGVSIVDSLKNSPRFVFGFDFVVVVNRDNLIPLKRNLERLDDFATCVGYDAPRLASLYFLLLKIKKSSQAR